MNPKSTRSPIDQPTFSMDDFAKALEQHDFQLQLGQVVRGKIFNHENNGVYIDIGGKALAFLPTEEASLKRVTDLPALLPVQDEQDFMIIREQDENGQVTLSRRRLEIQQVWEQLAEMQAAQKTVLARVSGVNKGGVTVDVQGLRGFIPRSHLREKEDLDALKGQTLTVSFLEVDLNRNKLVFSERLAARSASMSQLEIGQLLEGKVSGIKPFGVFVDVGGTSGLLHINQISKNYIESLPALFQIGQMLKVVIIDLDEGKGRISLSTKVLENYPGEMLEQMAEVMSSAEARSQRLKNPAQPEE